MCFGVKRALDMVESAAREKHSVATLGPLIHNPQVVHKLEDIGVRAAKSLDEIVGGAVVMPSHGITRETLRIAQAKGLEVIDATCPFVGNVHRRVEALAADGYRVVVVGDPNHSEVKAIVSAAGPGAVVVSSVDDAASIDWTDARVGVVSQTTQTPERFGEVVGFIAARSKEVDACNTICYATRDRQDAARALAPVVEAVFVVGGRNSANTNRLAEICGGCGAPTYHIETADEIDTEWVRGMSHVGLTAGASTPQWIIDDVKLRLENL